MPPPATSGQQMYNPPDTYRSAPNINLDHGTPQNSQYASPAVPGSLQPASSAASQQQQQQQPQQPPQPQPSQQPQQQQPRPGPTTSYTAPVGPSQAQIATNAQQYTLPTRSNTISQSQHSPHSSHSYSRSSPAGLGPDQKYIPFSNTPEQQQQQQPKYAAGTPAQKYYPTTPSGAASQSPLGLADIRPRANSNMEPENAGHGNPTLGDMNKVPSNSNYLAPWSIYAFDWCKWNVSGSNSAGKMAVGSYLEDNHNFVSSQLGTIRPQLMRRSDPHPRHADSAPRRLRPWRNPLWPRIQRHCRSHMLLPSHAHAVGAALVTKTVDRPPRNVWRPPALVVATSSLWKHHEQHHHTLIIREYTRTSAS